MSVRSRPLSASLALATVLLSTWGCAEAPAAGASADEGPVFSVDPTWPAERLANNWILGTVTGLWVDSRDHVWVVHQPETLSARETGAADEPPTAQCCVPAPPVIELDTEGRVVQGWGGPGQGFVWPDSEHGVYLDHEGHVWVGGYSHHHLMKFTRDGELLLKIGDPESSGGSNDPERLGGPAAVHVNPETNELFVADGYRNRRVVVFDAETGEYLRHWGAYGERPDDEYEFGSRDGPPPPQFGLVHGLVGSRDGRIYVTDRPNNRIQVFEESGEFVMEAQVAPETRQSGTAFTLGLSHDPEQRFLYLADGTNHKLWILRRDDLEVVGEIGSGGRQIGQFIRPHNVAVDSHGNIYTGEAADGRRVQRFTLEEFPDR